MKKSLSLFLIFYLASVLVFSLITTYPALASTRTVGVDIGDKFRYSVTASWSSDDPNATAPFFIVNYQNIEWFEVSVTAISGTVVTGNFTQRFWNETERTVGGWVDVDAGNGSLRNFFISANLTAGDEQYNSSLYSTRWTYIINGTVPRTYLGGVRDTNYMNATTHDGMNTWTLSFYWDKLTGVLVYEFVGNTWTGAYTYSWSYELQIISSAPTPTAVSLNTPAQNEIGTSSIVLGWSENSDDDFLKYEVYMSSSSTQLGSLVTTINTRTTTTYTAINLSPSTTYYITIRVYNTGNLYTDSNKLTVTTATEPPFYTQPWFIALVVVIVIIIIVIAALTMRKKRPSSVVSEEKTL